MKGPDFDAVVVGSGPNGFAAAITLQQAGLSVLILEAKSTTGGGMRTEELTLPGFHHDVCSAVHPLAMASPFFQSLPMAEFGLKFINPEILLAHPFDDGSSMVLKKDLEEMTARMLGEEAGAYRRWMKPLLSSWDSIIGDVLSPIHFPSHPLEMARFGWSALATVNRMASRFPTERMKGFWAGLAMHSQLPFDYLAGSVIGTLLLMAGHRCGWPLAEGGSGTIAKALGNYFVSLGGQIETGREIKSLDELPNAKAFLLDVGAHQLLEMAGKRLSPGYRRHLKNYRQGMGVYKIDWALSSPTPFVSIDARQALTLHLGGNFSEIAAGESAAWEGNSEAIPSVIFTQPSIFDPTRAPAGKHTAWAYCHVPLGSKRDMTAVIENQVERFAPGFRGLILGRHTMGPAELEEYNANYRGGDILGGANNFTQLFARPVFRAIPYRTSLKGVYLCSASTPPGGGVHGMCGYHAAKRALKDVFGH